MKTLHLTNSWHASSGGIATFYRELLRANETHGHEMRLIVPSETTRVEEVGRHGLIYHLQAPHAPFNRGYRMLLPHRYLLPGGDIVRILERELPDLIETCDKYSLLYLGGLLRIGAHPWIRRRPAIVGLSCERMDDNVAAYASRSRLGGAFARCYMRWFYLPLSDHHIAVSEHVAAELCAVSHGHKVTRGVWVLPMGADIGLFSPARRTPQARERLLRRLGAEAGATLVLYAGRLVPEKNLQLLTAVTAQWKDPRMRMVLAGDGSLRGELERAMGARACFLGHVAVRDELADLYANCDVFVHPNPREPFGIAPLEAMAAGLPLVAPNAGGVTTYAHAGNAWLAKPEAEAFAAAIAEACRPDARRQQKVEAARATAAQYGWASAASCYLKLYEQIHAWVTYSAAPVTAPRFVTTPKTKIERLVSLKIYEPAIKL